MNAIKGFQGHNRYMSNFYPCVVVFEDLTYQSSEAAYQAAKCSVEKVLDARKARSLGQKVAVKPDWEEIKLNTMYRILRAKFTQNSNLRQALLDTQDAYLEETNYWHDTFWGVYNGKGENHLGRLLMVVRDELREGII